MQKIAAIDAGTNVLRLVVANEMNLAGKRAMLVDIDGGSVEITIPWKLMGDREERICAMPNRVCS